MQDATALLHEAECLLDARVLDGCARLFDQAERLGANIERCSAGRWMVWMLLGQFERAWEEGDAIRGRGAYDPHRFWNGDDTRGKQVILRCLHGFGDAVQMLRFAPTLRERCDALIVEVPPRMVDVAPWFEGVGTVITWGALAPAAAPAWDVQMEIMELPYAFRVTATQLPVRRKYLHVPREVQRRIAERMGPRRLPRVGMVWAAGEWNPSRTIPWKLVRKLLGVDGCEFWNLQGGAQHSDWRVLSEGTTARDASECGEGIATLAGVIEQLDLVITVDTLAAHLAGALGKPAWVLLPYAADWRWMVARADSPWYPSLKLCRQPVAGNWDGLLDQVACDLRTWLQTESLWELAC
jgi:hypothetical protein